MHEMHNAVLFSFFGVDVIDEHLIKKNLLHQHHYVVVLQAMNQMIVITHQ